MKRQKIVIKELLELKPDTYYLLLYNPAFVGLGDLEKIRNQCLERNIHLCLLPVMDIERSIKVMEKTIIKEIR